MNKKLQDLVWSVLPKAFKEEVKELYDGCIKMMDIRPSASQIYANQLSTLEGIFGIHNLTSDAEGEEMLYVKAKTVREMYAANDRLIAEFIGSEIAKDAAIINNMLRRLYSSKCLPDENYSNVEKLEKNDEPKPAEPEENVNLSQETANRDKQFDAILKDRFSKERRLNIAAMAMQGLLANSHQELVDMKIKQVAQLSLEMTDALIAEAEKGNSDGED